MQLSVFYSVCVLSFACMPRRIFWFENMVVFRVRPFRRALGLLVSASILYKYWFGWSAPHESTAKVDVLDDPQVKVPAEQLTRLGVEPQLQTEADLRPAAPTSTSRTLPPATHPIQDCQHRYSNQFSPFVECIHTANLNSPIWNADRFPGDKVLIALVAHQRTKYLQQTIESLRKVHGIGSATLVVSHDGWFADVDALIRSIDFCRVRQIYHPFSRDFHVQLPDSNNNLEDTTTQPISSVILEPREWPGVVHASEGVNGPRRNILFDMQHAPFTFIADERLTQTAPKHHYWWLWNVLFQPQSFLWHGRNALVNTDEDRHVLFLEEDHIVAPDILVQLVRLAKVWTEKCGDSCFSINLGHHTRENLPADVQPPVQTRWNAVQYGNTDNIGMVWRRQSFERMWKEKQEFCGWNDYNWDLTMFHMAQKQWIPEASLTLEISRVRHIGNCGMHARNVHCDPEQEVARFQADIGTPLLAMLPQILKDTTLVYNPAWRLERFSQQKPMEPLEGWTDGRLWARDGSGGVDEFWKSNINRAHCLAVSQGFGWSE